MTSLLRDTPRRTAFFAAWMLLIAGTWPVSASSAAPPARAERSVALQSSLTDSPLPVFELHSGFWVNLHHFLYLQARLLTGDSASLDTGRGAAPPDDAPVSLGGLSAEESRAWQASVAFYAKDLVTRDLGLNGDMEIINNRLAAMETCSELDGKTSRACASDLDQALVAALERAAPVYRAHWWTQQDSANREWISRVAPMVRQMGVALSEQLAHVYQRPWPAEKLRVDVVWYGGPYGAYTSLNPVHVTISSHDVRNQDIYGFEVLFHESSHALAGAVTDAIAKEFRQRDKPIPRDLWHALLFYTTGELVRRDLASGAMNPEFLPKTTPATYQPYATRFGLYSGGWEQFHSLFDLYWRPYLDGEISFETAIARIANTQ